MGKGMGMFLKKLFRVAAFWRWAEYLVCYFFVGSGATEFIGRLCEFFGSFRYFAVDTR